MDNNNSFLVLFLAPVKEYLEDDTVSEILINGHQQIYIEREGKLEEVAARFVSEPALKAAAANIAKSVCSTSLVFWNRIIRTCKNCK